MTKRMVLAAVAAMAVCAAQAVSCKWDDWKTFNPATAGEEGKQTHYVDGGNVSDFRANSSFAIKVTLVLGNDFAWKSDATRTGLLLTLASGNNRYAFQGAGNGGTGGSDISNTYERGQIIVGNWTHNGDYAWDHAKPTDTILTAGGSYTFMFAYDQGTFSAYLDGQKVADYSSSSWGEDWAISGIYVGRDGDGNNNLPDRIDGSYTFKDFQYSTTLLPEPTALALLALGVAGLALRRRVA